MKVTEASSEEEMVLRFIPPDNAHEVPATFLAKALEGFQGFVHVLAVQIEKGGFGQRFKVPAEIADRYILTCTPPRKGSFAVATRITSATPELCTLNGAKDFRHKVASSLEAIHEGDQNSFSELFPDSRLRARAVSYLRSAIPPSGSGYKLGIMNGGGREIPLRNESFKRFEASQKTNDPLPLRETITGRLTGISFEDRKLTITYAPTSRDLECVYSEDLEPMLFENRRDLIQVTGKVKRNAAGQPDKIVDVEVIEELDMSPMLLSEVPLPDGRTLQIKERLSLTPVLSETEQLLSLEYEELQIDVFASTRDQLWEELQEQVTMLWIEYAEAPEIELSQPARAFRQKLHRMAEVTENAT